MARMKTGIVCLLTDLPSMRPFPWATATYLQGQAEAEKRHKAGERQKNCACGKWRWDDEVCCDGAQRQTLREWKAERRIIERTLRSQSLLF